MWSHARSTRASRHPEKAVTKATGGVSNSKEDAITIGEAKETEEVRETVMAVEIKVESNKGHRRISSSISLHPPVCRRYLSGAPYR